MLLMTKKAPKRKRRDPEWKRDRQRVDRQLAKLNQVAWGETVRKMELCLARGAVQSAHQALTEFSQTTMGGYADVDSSVYEIPGQDERMVANLVKNGFLTIRAVILADDACLLAIQEVSELRLASLRSAIDLIVGDQFDEVEEPSSIQILRCESSDE